MVDETLRQWGENIRLFRQNLNAEGFPKRPTEPCMTQAQLGERLDPSVHQSTVTRWEAGDFEPRRHYKAQLAAIFGTDVRVLFALVRSHPVAQ